MSFKKLLAVAFFSFFVQLVFAQITAPLPISKNGFVVIAHRGSHLLKPENSIAAFEAAIKEGADYVEMDLRTSKDRHLVLSHNETIDAKTNGKGRVQDLTWEELNKVLLVNTENKIYHLPDFKEALNACKGKINIYLDFKDADVEETYRQIKEAGMENNVVVYVNKVDQYLAWRKAVPAMPLTASLPESIRTKEDLAVLYEQMHLEVIDNVRDSSILNYANSHGTHVWLDVQSADENPTKWNEALQKGVQGVQTDHPEALVNYLKKNNLRNGSTAQAVTYPVITPPTYRTIKDVPYSYASKENIMDVYFPQVYDSAKVLIYIHGGSWVSGDKGEFPKYLIDELVGKRKYILVSMNYRLIKDGKNRFPSQMDDVSNAMKFLTGAAKKFHLNDHEFALMGGSAGGYMAMLYAFAYDTKKQIKTVVDFWGPTDLADKSVRADGSDGDRAASNLLGEPDSHAKIATDASPYYRITKESAVPTIFFHGGDDPLVPVSQAQKMYEKMLTYGTPVHLEIYPGEKHGISGAIRMDLYTKTLAWIDKYFPAK
jgi:glycerophosphoryl diester phosphodiesterase/acetyl esterase/lipase